MSSFRYGPGWLALVLGVLAPATGITAFEGVETPGQVQQAPPVAVRPPAETYEYDATDRRDPFRPLTLSRKAISETAPPLTPLQQYDIAQLKLVGIVPNSTPPRAVVEDSAGIGYILIPATPIGPNGGVVTEIRPRQVVVEEWQTDVIGDRHRREIVLEFPPQQTEPKK